MDSGIQFPRVMPLLLKEKKNKNDYIPKVVSIGPYHHGKPELASVNAFKPIAVELFVSDGPHDMEVYLRELLQIMGCIRECYEEESTVNYSDDELARMMLHDACFIIAHMEISAPEPEDYPSKNLKMLTMGKNLGLMTAEIVRRDMFLLENQIPLEVIKLLINLRNEAEGYENLLNRYLNISIFGEYRQRGVLERGKPLHLLEAFHSLLISNFVKLNKTGRGGNKFCCFKVEEQPHTLSGSISRWLCCPRSKCFDIESGLLRTLACNKAAKNPKNEKVIHSFRSVTDLKAKGIFFEPSPTRSLKDVDFKSHFVYATLQIPYWYVSICTKVLFLNMVAYELSPRNATKWEVTSYINFMKSLLERAEDVKELREKKILYNMMGSDEEVLSVYKDINTYGADNPEVFGQVKDKIQAHYKSRTKIWMAELIHTYFRTPWTAIAFFGAISLLAISAAQLHYDVHPN